jgi:hypothetical protein
LKKPLPEVLEGSEQDALEGSEKLLKQQKKTFYEN